MNLFVASEPVNKSPMPWCQFTAGLQKYNTQLTNGKYFKSAMGRSEKTYYRCQQNGTFAFWNINNKLKLLNIIQGGKGGPSYSVGKSTICVFTLITPTIEVHCRI